MPEFRVPPIVRYQPNGHFNYSDYHLNMLSVSQENFEKTANYSGAQLPLKHMVCRVVGGGNAKSRETCILPPSYPWTNTLSCDEFDENLIRSGLTTLKMSKKAKPLNLLSSSLKSAFSPTDNERAMLEKRVLPATADEAFQKNQLAPLTFLTNPLWSNLVPSNFIARAWSCCLNLPCEAYFFVEPKKEKGLFSSRHYVTTVTGPTNHVCPFEMRVEEDEFGKEIRYAYSFQPFEAGVYTIKVRLAASGTPNVRGSPLTIHVCQKPDNFSSTQHYHPHNVNVNMNMNLNVSRQSDHYQTHQSNCGNAIHNRLNMNLNNQNQNRNWLPPHPSTLTTVINNESHCRANCCMHSSSSSSSFGGFHQNNNKSRACRCPPSSSTCSSFMSGNGNGNGGMMHMVTHG